jgi:hypothetical protein
MPLKNRVTPFGEIVAIPERGTMMGNRGILHDEHQQVRRRWASRAWICCVLEWQGRRDPVMAPGHYTRLFFLDEPTALAAGHRPCAYCRRAEYAAFRDAWAAGRTASEAALSAGPPPKATEIDRVLHDERVGPGGTKRLHRADLASLPDGVMVTEGAGAGGDAGSGGSEALLRWRGALWRWSPAGYIEAAPLPPGPVLTLTPPSIVAALAHGYRPDPPAGLP